MLLISYGTRPEWLKIKPIINELNKNKEKCYKLLFINQHKDLVDKNYDYFLDIKDGPNRLDNIVESILNNEHIFENITHVMVQGDTCSAFSLALAAFHRNIKIIHLEAGLRTYDIENPYPEEFYRQSIGSMANLHLAPTNLNKKNLKNEGKKTNVYVVGNTSIDNLTQYKNTTYSKEVLITLHRRENHKILKEWFLEISKCANTFKDWKFTLVAHPNPNVQNNLKYLSNVNIVPPMTHSDMLSKIQTCGFLISDSGGLQEEASYFKKFIIVCRKTTERSESVGSTSIMCGDPKNLYKIVNKLSKDHKPKKHKCPFGDGNCSKKIVKILKNHKII